jgi:hypothetical protein
MSYYKLPLVIEEAFQRIGLIFEAHQCCVNYTSLPEIDGREGLLGHHSMPLYKQLISSEFDFAKNHLLRIMAGEEDVSCQE